MRYTVSMKRSCIIAEIGTSHQGDLGQALELIHAAAESGADTAKFQWVYADEIIHPRTGLVRLPTGDVPLHQRFRALEQKPEFFARLKEECERRGLEFLCTPFGVKSALQLWDLGVKRFKVASPELNHLPLLELLGATGADLIVSSGVSRIADIEEALETIAAARRGELRHLAAVDPEACQAVLRRVPDRAASLSRVAAELAQLQGAESGGRITLLHCMTAYPAPESEYNLLLVRNLRTIFGLPTGISDHSMDPLLVPVVSTILGGSVIEKHFTLSNSGTGLDDPIALTPSAFRAMVDAVRALERSWPAQAADWTDCEGHDSAVAYVMERLADAGLELDQDAVSAMLGTGVKALAPTEAENYGRTNRSIHAARALPAGTVLAAADLMIVRSEKILRPGLHPRHVLDIVGRRLSQAVPDGEGVRWQDLLQ